MDEIDPLVYGQSMAGAGGGGFYLAIMKEDVDRSVIQHILASVEVSLPAFDPIDSRMLTHSH